MRMNLTIISLKDNAFLNKTMRDESLNVSIQECQPQINREQNKLQQQQINRKFN
jgi:hypothetical protein